MEGIIEAPHLRSAKLHLSTLCSSALVTLCFSAVNDLCFICQLLGYIIDRKLLLK